MFKLLPPLTPGGPWRAGWNLQFNNQNGSGPIGNLVVTANTTIYGVTGSGGQYGFGTIFQIQP